MARQDQVYAGTLTVDGDEVYGEVWVQDTAAAIFERPANNVNVVLQDIELSNDDKGHLVIVGHQADDDTPVTVVCTTAEQPLGVWSAAHVTLPDPDGGAPRVLKGATVNWSQHRVIVKHKGETLVFPGASVRQSGTSALVTVAMGANFTMNLPQAAGCIPCGAQRPS